MTDKTVTLLDVDDGTINALKKDFFEMPNIYIFGTKLFLMLLLRKCIPTLDVSVHK